MRARLFSRTGELVTLDCEFSGEATIGRLPESTIVLPSKLVSGQHARVFFDTGSRDYALEDLQSKNGTRLDGLPVTRRELSDLHVITIAGTYDLVFQRLSEDQEDVLIASVRSVDRPETEAPVSAGSAPPVSTPLELTGDETVFDRGGLPTTPELSRPERRPLPPAEPVAGDQLPVGAGTVLDRADVLETPALLSHSLPTAPVDTKESRERDAPGDDVVAWEPASTRPAEESVRGMRRWAAADAPGPDSVKPRERVTEVLLEVLDHDGTRMIHLGEGAATVGRSPQCTLHSDVRTLSRTHAVIRVEANQVVVEDLGSSNGTFVNGKRLTEPERIRPGMVVVFGEEVRVRLVEVPGAVFEGD